MKIIAQTFAKFIVILIAGLSIIYIQTTIYDFSEPTIFTGNHFYNPYHNWDHTNTIKANLHAHTEAWGGTTNGANSAEQIIKAYAEKEYDVIGISNYFSIDKHFDTSDYYIPLYEHGINIFKTHKQAINPDEVLYFDFPLFQNTSQKQQIINKLKEKNALVAINHPKFMNGHSIEDLKLLEGYHFIEVLNHYRVSDNHWDAALSAGKLTWIVSNDDVHDLKGVWNHFVMWNMIKKGNNKDEILNNMMVGKSYGMRGKKAGIWNRLIKCEIETDSLVIEFKNNIDSIMLIGQEGKLLKKVETTNRISLATNEIETYVRCKASSDFYSIFLNPIIRYDGENIPFNYLKEPNTNTLLTWIYRLGVLVINILLFKVTFFRKRKQFTD